MPTKKLPRPAAVPTWPEGRDLFASIAKRAVTSLSEEQCNALVLAYMDTPGLDTEWTPSAGRTARDVLVEETTVVALWVQAWCERAEWALLHCDDPAAQRNYLTALRVLKSSTKYLFKGLEGAST